MVKSRSYDGMISFLEGNMSLPYSIFAEKEMVCFLTHSKARRPHSRSELSMAVVYFFFLHRPVTYIKVVRKSTIKYGNSNGTLLCIYQIREMLFTHRDVVRWNTDITYVIIIHSLWTLQLTHSKRFAKISMIFMFAKDVTEFLSQS